MMAVAVPLILLGLLFLVAAMTNPPRMYVAAAFGGLGAFLAYLSMSWIAYLNFIAPENLEPLILRIAKKSNGYFTVRDVMQKLNLKEETVEKTLALMMSKGAVMSEFKDGVEFFRVEAVAVQAKRMCEFCKTEFNVRDALTKCPNCGGNVKIA